MARKKLTDYERQMRKDCPELFKLPKGVKIEPVVFTQEDIEARQKRLEEIERCMRVDWHELNDIVFTV